MSDDPRPPEDTIRVILVEDDEDVRIGCRQALELAGFPVQAHASVEAARGALQPEPAALLPVVVLCDVRLPGTSGLDWQRELQALDAELPVILITGHGDIAMAVQAMQQGTYDFIAKPFASDHLASVVRRAADKRRLALQVRALRRQLEQRQGIEAMLLGRSAAMERLRQRVQALAATSADVVIYGETGTGKELVARCLHEHGPRRKAHFVALNCGGLPENLAETELFGHEAGAFTGAQRTRVGKFEHAHGGTLFLDEIESMPLAVQVKLLRALQERSIERIGSNKPIAVDCRVIAASKEDLKLMAEQQRFRADLYYRIGVAFIELPPLRERREDIPLLFEHFSLAAQQRFQRAAPALTPAQTATLMAHAWPGNVRELRNVAERHVLGLAGDDLPSTHGPGAGGAAATPAAGASLPQQLEHVERTLVADALRRHQGDAAATAQSLGIGKQTLYDKLKRLGLRAEAFR
ncbi:sigma-54-dependent transcriptional regulator [Aquincola tertiaricarbonis]|uniref:sigma-54-dependent transcriptional regulator n=1 Tax=Aquincola tertiaricarbonis TaxID=391953 RepID=UPI000614FF42|nr:sigma-54 dependent transcriptional regulator [Aquincola tertiaricarbonis]